MLKVLQITRLQAQLRLELCPAFGRDPHRTRILGTAQPTGVAPDAEQSHTERAGHVTGSAAPDYALIVVPMPLIDLAAGLITPDATAALMNAVPPGQAGIAAGTLNTARQIGAAMGVALAGALL